jgi:hypothetical protein
MVTYMASGSAPAPLNSIRDGAPTLNFQHPAKNRTTAIARCVASRRAHAAWLHAHAHGLARAQSACASRILGTRPRRCPRRQTGARKGAGAGRQADDITRPRDRTGDSVTAIAARGDAARRNFLAGANAGARNEAPYRRLPAGPGQAVWRLSNLRPGTLRNMGTLPSLYQCVCQRFQA